MDGGDLTVVASSFTSNVAGSVTPLPPPVPPFYPAMGSLGCLHDAPSAGPFPAISLVVGVAVLLQTGGAVYFDGQGVLTISGSNFNSNTAGDGDAVDWGGLSPEYYTNEEANAAFGPTSG